MMTILLIVTLILAITLYVYLRRPQFGQPPTGDELAKLKQSSFYHDEGFKNLTATPQLTGSGNTLVTIAKFLFGKDVDAIPPAPLPSIKTDLHALDLQQDLVIWMGHSSYFLHMGGKRILIDPVFSLSASPVPGVNKAFDGSNIYTADDIPDIDYLLISHDHWDHLDYPTIKQLRTKIKRIVLPLGVGSHFVQWGFDKRKIHEGDWFSTFELEHDLTIHLLPARHFSGRLLGRNKTLWASFALITPQHKLFISGDSGYGAHFKEIGDRFGGFDLAILECGQYNENWRYIHMMPEETAQAGQDLNAAAIIPSHNSKFKLAHHTWDDPLKRVVAASENKAYRLLTPMIGQTVSMDEKQPSFPHWWETVAGRPVRSE
ncbi:MBL fold metallo-hydrolase [Brenneria izbisi]|uniref:MBL fold metallo-hydrolase n=1 Tax=Brenneria izbisi TaxID=2939450 RepID=A0AA42C5X1_9GAMM|nr:MBL fold metallo-hydrolase [Brenneria izbisi]MCV9879621.1 MBL fold metallo-hydrolase [Brenneria izbisi]MCV9883010.1 MBL fold metallo-hydrolase [Brenneria izbisi]